MCSDIKESPKTAQKNPSNIPGAFCYASKQVYHMHTYRYIHVLTKVYTSKNIIPSTKKQSSSSSQRAHNNFTETLGGIPMFLFAKLNNSPCCRTSLISLQFPPL